MTLPEAIQILSDHQKWRRGQIDEMPKSAHDLGKAIDMILEHFAAEK